MSIEDLEKEIKHYDSFIEEEVGDYDFHDFMQYCINTFKDQQAQIAELRGKVRKLEQAKTFFPMTENKHRVLLNNCVDNDEVILHKREIKEVRNLNEGSRGDRES